jgi:hypothetical protein
MEAAQVEEKTHNLPILIIDRIGKIGQALASQLKTESLVVLASQQQPQDSQNLIFIPFLKQFPSVPDNRYSHIFLIDDGSAQVKESLSVIFKKTEEEKSTLIYIVSRDEIRNEEIEYVEKAFHDFKILLLGDVFEEDDKIVFKNVANRFIYEAREEGKIEVPGDGQTHFFPISFQDSIQAILKVTFSNYKNHLFYLFPKQATAYLSFAHLLQRSHPSLRIDFVKLDDQKNPPLPQNGEYIFENYSLKEKLKQVKILDVKKEKKIVKEVKVEKVDFGKKRKRSGKWKIFLLLFFVLLLPAISTSLFALIGGASLYLSRSAIEKGDLKNSQSLSLTASESFSASSFFLDTLQAEVSMVGLSDFLGKYKAEIEMGQTVAKLENSVLKIIDKIKTGGNENNQSIAMLIADVRSSLEIYQGLSIKNQTYFNIPKEYQSLIDFSSATLDVWPEIFGFNNEKKYLVLFQNNMELRPGGGFIGSYGILTVKNGQITDFTINDVYDADGQLKGHVEPPFPIRRYLGVVHWYLRDSNYDVSFDKAAATSAYFLNLETGEKVNGVIGVDVTFVKFLLAAIGPVYVDDYKQTVNADNLFYLTETNADKNSFPGSRQKKNFLSSLFTSIKLELLNKKNIPVTALLENIEDSMLQKHLLFAFDDQTIQKIFNVNNWSSALPETNDTANEMTDFFGINEANIGIDKANYFIKRSLSKTTTIEQDGTVDSTIFINYKNISDGKWPGGPYRNYLRLMLPQGSQITSILIGKMKQSIIPAITNPLVYESKNFKQPNGLEVEEYTEQGKSIFGFIVNVPTKSTVTVTFSYSLPNKVNLNSLSFNYNFQFFKQPGTDPYAVSLSLNIPNSFSFVSSANFQKNGKTITYDTLAETDFTLPVMLGK